MKRVFLILAGLFAIPACVMAQALPTTPPAGYDSGGRYPGGAVNDVSYYSSVAGATLTMKVYTPPNYDPNKKYGVIYCYQGISTDTGTIFADWCVGAGIVCDNLIGEGKISKGVIIVALDDQFNGTYGSDVNGMTLNDAIPFVDSHYPTYADADHRGVYGYSWGGGYTFNIGCGNLNTFHHIAPSSAAPNKAGDDSLFPNGGAEAKRVMKTLLIACGNSDGLFGASEGAHNYCVNNGIPHAWWPVNGGGHNGWQVWRPHMWNFILMADAAGISDPTHTRSAYSQFEAESADSQSGGSSESCGEGGLDLGSIVNGNYIVYRNVDFSGGATNFQARVASATSGGNIEVRLDATNGTLVGTCAVAGTGGWQTWVTRSIAVSGATGGIHNVYLKFTGGSGYLFNVNWWKFGGPSSPVSVPSAPGGLVATAGVERAALRWTAITNATTYNVKRSTTSGGTYTTVANVAGTNYTDRGVFGGTTNYYKVSALNVGGESADSASPASVTPTVTVPAPWLTRDIGAVGLSGSASFTNGIFTVTGSGADIGGTTDAFRFVQVATNGDCTIVARVASLESHINSASKAGVMIRESLGTNAANAFIAVTPGNGVVFQYRSSTGGGSVSNNVTGMSAPCWVKLVRSGNTFTGSYSSDGSSWTQLGSATFTMASTEYVGLALTSHNLYTLCTATFDRVTGPGWAPPYATTPTGLVATAGIEQVALRWTASANATSYNVKRASTIGGPYTTVASVATTNYTDTRLVGRTKYYYLVSAVNTLGGESDNSASVNATPTVNVPLPWMTQDIGDAGLWGNAGVTNGVFTINGSGGDIWDSADAFRFVYITNSSDCTVIARVASVSYSDGWAKAGLMVRESLDANAVNAFIAVTPTNGVSSGNGVTWQYRPTTGGSCPPNTPTSGSPPYWVKLVRSGNTFTGYCSPNGTTWTQLGTISLTNIAYIGLAVTAHNNSALCAAKFDNVSLPGWPPPLLVADAVAASSTRVRVTWNNLTNATSYIVRRSVISGGPYTLIASGLIVTNYSDDVASVRAGYYYVVSALIGGSETNSPEAAVRFLKLTGGIIGTAGSWDGSSTIAKVFDGDLTTYFDAPSGNANDAWVGLDFGAGVSNVITKINYCPRSGSESRMTNGIFQGANNASFTGAVTLFTITNQPVTGVFTSASLTNTAGFRYVRYLSPNEGFGNVAELEFYGYPWAASAPVPDGLVATPVSTSQINLTWNAFNNATSYTVKRSLTNGGSYTTIASVTTTNYPDSGLAGGTMYYYVVSAVVGGTNSADSAQAAAATFSPTEGSLVHRYSFSESGGTTVADSVGGPVWNGTLPSGGTLASGQLTLTSAASQYANLPAGIVSSLSNFTILAWVNLTSISDWSRLFDFGNDTSTYMFLTPQSGDSGPVRFAIKTGGGSEQQINGSSTLSTGVRHQVAVTLNSGIGILYVDGVAVGTNSGMTLDPTSLGSTGNNYLGKSQYPDPYLDGALDEFRIYNVGLSAADVALMNAGGPSQTRLAGTVTLGDLSQTYDGTAKSVTATTTPTNLTVSITYSGSVNAPTNAGSYTVIGTISDANYQGSATNTLVINDAIRPQMSLTLVGTNLTVSWPQTSTGFTVQFCTNLTSGNWLNVTSPAPQIVGGQWQVVPPPPAAAGQVFYRLMK